MGASDLIWTAEIRIPLLSDLLDIVDTVGSGAGIPLIAVAVGFAIGIWGHAIRSERTIGFGIVMVFVASILFFLGSLGLEEELPPPQINEEPGECRPFCK